MSGCIAVVDDDEDIVDYIRSHLQQAGYKVEGFSSGYDVMRFVETTKVDLVVSDYRMNDGDGGSLSHFCQAQGVPCIIVSGYAVSDIVPYVPKGTDVLVKALCIHEGTLLKAIAAKISMKQSA